MSRVTTRLRTWGANGGLPPCSTLPIQPDTVVTTLILTAAVETRWLLFVTKSVVRWRILMMWSRGKVAGNRNIPFDFPCLTRPRYLFIRQVTKQKTW